MNDNLNQGYYNPNMASPQTPYQQTPSMQQPSYEQQANMQQYPYQNQPSSPITGGTKALYCVIAALFPIIAIIMVVATGNPNSPGYIAGSTKEKMKWSAIGCAICFAFSIITYLLSSMIASMS